MHLFILLVLIIGALGNDCPSNSHYNDCGSACPVTCENYRDPPQLCIRICVPGCHCDEKDGYVKTKDGRCVLPAECEQNRDEANCLAKPDEGLCRGSFDSYYYDPKKGDCFVFIYGGCGGNGNRYATYDECKSKCGDIRVWESDSDVCRLPFEPGTGSDVVKRFGFNNALGECTRFVYTGEGGNGNNFESLEECHRACGKTHHLPSACEQEKVVGLCDAAFRRYYYNKESGECESFIYGGCQGNSNNFNSKEDCEAVCKA